jgi:hypothetical protein
MSAWLTEWPLEGNLEHAGFSAIFVRKRTVLCQLPNSTALRMLTVLLSVMGHVRLHSVQIRTYVTVRNTSVVFQSAQKIETPLTSTL